jgi:hypothetical protein
VVIDVVDSHNPRDNSGDHLYIPRRFNHL